MKKEEKESFIIRDLLNIVVLIISIGGVVAYAHTHFAAKDDLVEVRKMVYDLWKKEGFREQEE